MTVQINGTNGVVFPDGINPNSDKSLSASGYQKLPGGLIIQWGTLTVANVTSTPVLFPIAFPNACRFADFVGNANNSSADQNNYVTGVSASGFNIFHGNGVSVTALWIAIGY